MFHPAALNEDPSATKGRAECFQHTERERETSSSTDDPKTLKELKKGWTDFLIIWATYFIFQAAVRTATSQRVPGARVQSGGDKSSPQPFFGMGTGHIPQVHHGATDLRHPSRLISEHRAAPLCRGLRNEPWAQPPPLNCSGHSHHLWPAQEPSKMQKQQANPEKKTHLHFMKLHRSFLELLWNTRKLLYSEIQEGSNNAKRSKYTLLHTMK